LVVRTAADARDITGDPRITLSTTTERDTYFVSEPIRVRLRLEIDPQFLAENMVQLFARPLDVPVQIRAAWIDELAGAVRAANVLRGTGTRSMLALDEEVAEAVRAPDDLTGAKRVVTLDVERTYLARAPGELAIPEALAYFAFATRFETDFVNGRVAKDRVDAFVRSRAITLRIVPLPDAGRPAEFSGAVGRFKVEAEVSSRSVAVGESFQLVLRIEGEGNVHAFDVPSFAELAVFDVRGTLDAKEEGRRVITYDLSPRDIAVKEVPALGFAYFDTTPPASYRVAKTAPVRIDVKRAQSQAPASSDSRSAGDAAASERTSRGLTPALWIALSVPLMVAIILASRARRRAVDPRK
jgi:hypothetical protein